MNEKKIKEFYNILVEANKIMNLTKIIDYDDYLIRHIKDSRLAEEYINGKVLDIGSGAGFPALVIKIDKPEIDLTMIDSVGKKVKYLNETIEKLGLDNSRAYHTRIEDFEEKENFDTVTARAVAQLNTPVEYALPFVKVGGTFVAYNENDIEEEIKNAKYAISMLGGKIENIIEKKLDEEITRKIIIIKKVKSCAKAYPRPQNKPRIKPLV